MESILIQNFKAIKNTAQREIKVANLTILMGEQATGKSTVAKLVYFFKKLPEEFVDELLSNRSLNSDNFIQKLHYRISLLFRRLFGSTYFINKFYATYKYNNGLIVKINKIQGHGRFDIYWSVELSVLQEKVLHLYNEINSYEGKYDYSSRREHELLANKINEIIKHFFGINQHILYMPSSRNMTVVLEEYLLEIVSKMEKSFSIENDPSENSFLLIDFVKYSRYIKNKFRLKNFEQVAKEANKFNDHINDVTLLISRILAGRYSNHTEGETILYDDKNYVTLSNSSSGQQEAIRILQDIFLEVLDNRPVFRVYEEPESHLSPSSQLGIIQLISMLANRNPGNQVIIPTHTPYLLREVDNMLKAAKIAKEHPELEEEVRKILKPYYWLESNSLSVYQLTRDGEIEDAIDPEFGGVNTELFDEVSNKISDQFDQLLNLQYNEQ